MCFVYMRMGNTVHTVAHLSHRTHRKTVLAYGCAILGVWQVAVGLGQLFGVCSSGHYLYAVTGNFFNPAPYGAFIAVMLAVVIAVYKEHPGRILGVAAIVMTVMLLRLGAVRHCWALQ